MSEWVTELDPILIKKLNLNLDSTQYVELLCLLRERTKIFARLPNFLLYCYQTKLLFDRIMSNFFRLAQISHSSVQTSMMFSSSSP
jgi:hypothetical protein